MGVDQTEAMGQVIAHLAGTGRRSFAYIGPQPDASAGRPVVDEIPAGAFAEEEKSLAQARKTFLLAAGAAVQKFRDQLANEQEIVGALANIVMDVYAIESSLRRAQKSAASKGQSSALMAEAARAFIYDALDRIEKEAPAPRSLPSSTATRSPRSSRLCAAWQNTRLSTRSRFAAALPTPFSRRIAILSTVAERVQDFM